MRKWWLILLVTGALISRWETSDRQINRLEPVQTIQVMRTGDGVQIRTDTGAAGYGSTLSSAVENLHSATDGVVFLETAQYLLVDDRQDLELLSHWLRPACDVCLARDPMDLELAGEYLAVHKPETTLLQYLAGKRDLMIYYSREGRGQLAPSGKPE